MSRQNITIETKSFITETAFQLFLDKGYRNTSLNDLVKATRLSKGAFYHYFENKEKIYRAVIDTYFLSYHNRIDWAKTEQMNAAEIEAMIREFYRTFVPEIIALTKKGMSRYFIMFFEAYETYPEFKETMRDIYRKMRRMLAGALAREKVPDPAGEALRLMIKYEGLIFWLSVFPEEKITRLIDEI